MYCVYEHGKDEHGGYHVYPCSEGWCDTFEEAAALSRAWNDGQRVVGWEWVRYYPIWVYTRADKLTDKIGRLTTTLATKTAALKETQQECVDREAQHKSTSEIAGKAIHRADKAEEYGRLCAKEAGMAGLDWGELLGEIRALRKGLEIYKKRDVKAKARIAELEVFEHLERESWDLRCYNAPTGGDDWDVCWVVIEHHMDAPMEREIGNGSTPQEAIKQAIAKV